MTQRKYLENFLSRESIPEESLWSTESTRDESLWSRESILLSTLCEVKSAKRDGLKKLTCIEVLTL